MWGKIIGGMAGFAMGGPMGAVVGAALGHAAETGGLAGNSSAGPSSGSFPGWTRAAWGWNPAEWFAAPHPAQIAGQVGGREQIFALCVTVLAAKLCRADGPVNRAEIDAFKRHFRVPAESAREIGRLFDQARDSPEPVTGYARQLAAAFAEEPSRLELVMTAFFAIARADSAVTEAELRFLRALHAQLNLSSDAWERATGDRPRAAPPSPDEPDPYGVLGVSRRDDEAAMRAAWKRLVRENHPDVLSARGASSEQVTRASHRAARINAAWDRIKRERGWS